MQAADSTAPSSAGLEPRIRPLTTTQDDVMSLRRLGPDLFEATKRSGEVWMGDAVLLGTLPQGRARLATLTVTEIMKGRNAKPKPEEDGMNPTSVGSRSTEPPPKRARAHGENQTREELALQSTTSPRRLRLRLCRNSRTPIRMHNDLESSSLVMAQPVAMP